MHHNLNTLRDLLERIARVPERPELSKADAAILSEQFRDCHLELRRLELKSFSEEQLNRIKQMDYRLQMVVSGHAVADSIPSEARRTLEAFGWTLTD
jgi:hypothetical protein